MTFRSLVLCLAVISACGMPPTTMDAGVDAGAMTGGGGGATGGGGGAVTGGGTGGGTTSDAGPPPRTVFGNVTINGTPQELWSGYGTTSRTAIQLRLGTIDTLDTRYLITIVLPADAGVGFSAPCGMTPVVLMGAQHITLDAGTAFFALNQTCQVALSQVAQDVDEDYVGTFSGSIEVDPRSVLDAGYSVINLTNGNFTVTRTF